MIVLFSSGLGLVQTHLSEHVFASGSHTEQVGRTLEPKFPRTELKKLFHLEKKGLRRMWSLDFRPQKSCHGTKGQACPALPYRDFKVRKSWIQT